MTFSPTLKFSLSAIMLAWIVMLSSDPAEAAGYRVIKGDGAPVHVWYPTDSAPIAGRLGPFDVAQAVDAPLRQGKYEIVLMSHGVGGWARNHHLTAQALADAGFIVIAPDHAADPAIGSSKTAEALAWRVAELGKAIENVIRLDGFADAARQDRIHGLGFSLGTASIMAAAGAVVDLDLVARHCDENDDPAFCDDAGFIDRMIMRFMRDLDLPELDADVGDRYSVNPFITGDIALIAPIGQGLHVVPDSFSAKRVFVRGMAQDEINRPEFHTEPYRALIPANRLHSLSLNRDGNHFAFVAPFAERVKNKDRIAIAIDPPGFDRRAFLDSLNAELVGYFTGK